MQSPPVLEFALMVCARAYLDAGDKPAARKAAQELQQLCARYPHLEFRFQAAVILAAAGVPDTSGEIAESLKQIKAQWGNDDTARYLLRPDIAAFAGYWK